MHADANKLIFTTSQTCSFPNDVRWGYYLVTDVVQSVHLVVQVLASRRSKQLGSTVDSWRRNHSAKRSSPIRHSLGSELSQAIIVTQEQDLEFTLSQLLPYYPGTFCCSCQELLPKTQYSVFRISIPVDREWPQL